MTNVIRRPGFWLILGLLVIITLPHYEEAIPYPAFLTQLTANLGLTRHSFERIAYLAPIVWAGFLFGQKGAMITSLAALGFMLPRAIFISPAPTDSIFETVAVFIIGNVMAITFQALRKERERRLQLEAAQQEIQTSEQRYRELFENAHDAIWLHNLEGNILAANKASLKLTGYSLQRICSLNEASLFPQDGFNLIQEVEQQVRDGKSAGSIAEVKLIRKDGTEVFVQLAIGLVPDKSGSVVFQHIARDITEQKRLQENQRFYLQQVTQAQEEERKRISQELHDETIQGLIAFSRSLDPLVSSRKQLSPDGVRHLEALRQQANDIIEGVRRLCRDLRPATLDYLGLLPALRRLVSDMAGYSGITININVLGRSRRLPGEVELVLFRITQEALRNVWRHAAATQASVSVEFGENKIRVTIKDNGKGFDFPKRAENLTSQGQLGLIGMQERARLIGGILTIQSELGNGTTITVDVNFSK